MGAKLIQNNASFIQLWHLGPFQREKESQRVGWKTFLNPQLIMALICFNSSYMLYTLDQNTSAIKFKRQRNKIFPSFLINSFPWNILPTRETKKAIKPRKQINYRRRCFCSADVQTTSVESYFTSNKAFKQNPSLPPTQFSLGKNAGSTKRCWQWFESSAFRSYFICLYWLVHSRLCRVIFFCKVCSKKR